MGVFSPLSIETRRQLHYADIKQLRCRQRAFERRDTAFKMLVGDHQAPKTSVARKTQKAREFCGLDVPNPQTPPEGFPGEGCIGKNRCAPTRDLSEDFSLLVAFCSLHFRGFFVAFPWLFRGPRFGQNLRVLALEQSSESFVVTHGCRNRLKLSQCSSGKGSE